jgi:hypothetical protein
MNDRLIAFESIHQALRAEKTLLKAGLRFELVPTPREISASCGQSIALSAADLSDAIEIISREIINYRGVYAADFQQRIFEKLD